MLMATTNAGVTPWLPVTPRLPVTPTVIRLPIVVTTIFEPEVIEILPVIPFKLLTMLGAVMFPLKFAPEALIFPNESIIVYCPVDPTA